MRKAEGIKELFFCFVLEEKMFTLSIHLPFFPQTPLTSFLYVFCILFHSFILLLSRKFFFSRSSVFIFISFSFFFVWCKTSVQKKSCWNEVGGPERKCLLKKKWKFFLIKKMLKFVLLLSFSPSFANYVVLMVLFFQFIPSPLTLFHLNGTSQWIEFFFLFSVPLFFILFFFLNISCKCWVCLDVCRTNTIAPLLMNNFFFIHFYYFTFLSVPSLACASCFYSLIYEKTLKIMVRFRVILIFALCCFSLASQFTVLLCVDILLPLMLFVVAFILVSATTHLAFHNGFFFVLLVQVFYFSLENECIYNIGGDGVSDGQIYWLAKWLFDLIHCALKFFQTHSSCFFSLFSRIQREKKMKCDKICQFAVFISTKPAVNRIWY